MRRIILLVVLLTGLLLNSVCLAAPAQIAVAIELDKLAVQLRGQSDYQVLDMNNNLIYESKGKQNAFLNIKDGVLYINNEKLPSRVRLVPATDNFIEINRRAYRGSFSVNKTHENTIQIVNIVPLEDYVTSVLSKEIELGFDEQVLKAQAVAIRSQAYFLMEAGSGAYDIVANDVERGGLIYLGKDAESKEALQATRSTAGEIMIYDNKPVFALWHVSSGGYTEYGREFFNSELPYLQMVKDLDDKSKFYSWKYDFAPADLDAAFERAGYKLGKIQLLKLSKLPKTRPATSPPADRSAAGRLKEVTIVGEQGQVIVLPASKLVSILALNSNLFDVAIGTPIPKDIIATVTDAMGNEHELNRIEVNITEREGYRLPGDDENTRRISRAHDDKVVFYGYGTGQGFGLSQQGAQAMASKDLQAKRDAIKAAEAKLKAAAKNKPQTEVKPETAKPKDSAKAGEAAKAKTTDKKDVKAEVKPAPQAQPAAKKEEVKLASDYYKKILNYYFTSVRIEKVY